MATKTYKIVIDVESGDVKQLEKELAGVKGEIKSIDQQVAGLDIDQKFKAAAGGIKVMAGALAGAVGTLGVLGIESDKFGEFEKKAASAIAVAIGFRDVAEGLNEMRVALQGVTVAQLKANAAALANPYVLLAAAIAGLVAGFAKLSSVLTDGVVGPFESFVNMVKSLGNPFKYASLQAQSYAENLAKIDNEKAISALERSVAVLKAFGQDTIDLEIDAQERRLKALEEGSEEYEKAFTELLVLRATKAKAIQDKEIKDAEDAAKKKADAELKAYNKRLEELKFQETLEAWKKQDEAAFAALGEEAAITFTDVFSKTVKEEFDPNSILYIDPDDIEVEESLFGENGVITKYQNGLQEAIDKTLGDREKWQNFVNLASEAFANIEMLSQQRYDRTILNLQRERDEILNNTSITEQARAEALERLEQKEKETEIRRIKAERDQFTLKQTLLIAEEVMKAKSYAMEQIQIAKLNVAKSTATAQEIALAGTASVAKASMSLGAFVAALGPFGIAAFALSIGGIIASIIAARKKAKAQIAAIGSPGATAGGGVSAPSIPQAVTQQQAPQTQLSATPTVRAYVLSGDARSAQEADAKLAARRSLG